MKDDVPSLNVSGSEAEEDTETKIDGEKDPDFSQVRVNVIFIHHHEQ